MFKNWRNYFIKKDFGGKEIIAEVGLAVIAVALIIVFRGGLYTLVTSLVDLTQDNIEKLFTITT